MEQLINFTLFGSGILFGIAIIFLIFTFILSDLYEEGSVVFIAIIIFLGLNYFWGDLPILPILTFKNIFLYLFIGFLYSLIRTYFKGKELKKEEKKSFKLKEHVFRWWLLFPFSVINWVFGHLLKDVFNLIYNKIETLYDKLFNLE